MKKCLTHCNPTGCRPSGTSVQGILQTRILEWVAMPSSRGSKLGLLRCRHIVYRLRQCQTNFVTVTSNCSHQRWWPAVLKENSGSENSEEAQKVETGYGPHVGLQGKVNSDSRLELFLSFFFFCFCYYNHTYGQPRRILPLYLSVKLEYFCSGHCPPVDG